MNTPILLGEFPMNHQESPLLFPTQWKVLKFHGSEPPVR